MTGPRFRWSKAAQRALGTGRNSPTFGAVIGPGIGDSSPVARALGEDFHRLHAVVRKHYSEPTVDLSGVMDRVHVSEAIRPLAWLSHRLFRAPVPYGGKDVKFTVRSRVDGSGTMHWLRIFFANASFPRNVTFESHMIFLGDHRIMETTRYGLALIHRRTGLGTALEEASGCSSESGIMVLEQKPARKLRSTQQMLPQNKPDRIRIVFDDHRLVANAGLLLPATLARHLGLRELVDHHLDLGGAPGRANTGDKMLTLVASALAGGDCIDDADALRAGGTVGVLGCVVKAPSTLGTFLRSFRWGHVRQLDRVSRQLLARAWAAGARPGDSPLTIDLDSTICETYGLAKEGARHHGYTGARGYHPLLAIAAGTGEVLMSRLREGRANTARGAAHFLRETVGRVRYGGARGQLTVRADSGFYAHTVVAACREMDVRFSITIRQRASLRDLIEAIPEEDWTPIPYWMDGAADVAETTYTPFQTKPGRRAGAAHCPAGEADARFPARPLRQIQLSRLHHRPRWGDAGTGGRSSPPRRGRERHTRPQVRRRAEPHAVGALRRQRRLAGGPGDGA